jgi:hypothetical protein
MIATARPARGLPLSVLFATGLTALTGCGGGGGGGGDGGGGGGQPTGPVTISGKAQYEFPPPVPPSCQGLDFNSIELRPIRQATLELVNAASDAVLDSAVTDDNGDFALTANPQLTVFIRVRAELKKTGSPSWDVEVRDNTAVGTGATPRPLAQRALYVLDGASFNSGTADSTRDITARTGWNASTSSYTGTRAAAPFAILDTVYSAMQLVVTEDPGAAFAPLDVFWSVNNTASGGPTDVDAGELGTSFFRSGNELFLLGDFDVDADEFDDHVVAHEWGHYFENNFSRSDSIGGSHTLGDLLDMRVAFGEGSATALSGMVLANPTYCDTSGSSGFRINIEGQAGGTPGWYNEISVMKLVYDLWDSDIDGADTDSLGFGPLYEVMTGAQAATPAFTSIFSFAATLKAEQPAAVPFIDALLEAEGITAAGITPFGEGEMNDAEGADVLPVYRELMPDGTVLNICSNSEFDRSGGTLDATGNKLSEHRYLRMSIATAGDYAFSILTDLDSLDPPLPPDDPEDERDQSDPDVLVVLNGQPMNTGDLGFSGVANEEAFTLNLAAGDYVLDLVEFRYQDEESPADYPARACFDVTVMPAT